MAANGKNFRGKTQGSKGGGEMRAESALSLLTAPVNSSDSLYRAPRPMA